MNKSIEKPSETDFSQFWIRIQHGKSVSDPVIDTEALDKKFGQGVGKAFADWRHFTVSGSEISDAEDQAAAQLKILKDKGLDPFVILAARTNAKIVPIESFNLNS